MSLERALVKDEGTAEAPYFIIIERKYGSTSGGALRFNRRRNADRICAAINNALEAEGRLWRPWEDNDFDL